MTLVSFLPEPRARAIAPAPVEEGAVIAPSPDGYALYGSAEEVADPHRRMFALPLVELPGLSPRSRPGSVLELWVTWEPPVTEEPQVQMLLGRVRLEEIIEPPVAEGPYMVLISVKRNQVGDLLWGDRFGALSAVSLP